MPMQSYLSVINAHLQRPINRLARKKRTPPSVNEKVAMVT